MELGTRHSRSRRVAVALTFSLLVGMTALSAAREFTVEELKERVADASIQERPALCIQISERQLAAASRLYAAGDNDQARVALVDVAAFSELARDYAIQSHKHEKQSEIAIRKMSRKLADLKHTVEHEEQERIQETIDHLDKIRLDLLTAMFPKGVKK